MPQLSKVVELTTCTVSSSPLARSTAVQVSVWVGAVPLTAQFDGAPVASFQSTPSPAGRASLITTPRAMPGPSLCAVTVNPMSWPASTTAASAALVSVTAAHCTTTDASSEPVPPFVEVNDAVLGTVAQS